MYSVGLDIGSTTIKYVVMDENNKIIKSNYLRQNTATLMFAVFFIILYAFVLLMKNVNFFKVYMLRFCENPWELRQYFF